MSKKLDAEAHPPKRKHVRFKPHPIALAKIDTRVGTEDFQPEHTTLVVNESFSGCALVALKSADLPSGALCRVKVGELDIVTARIKWRVDLDQDCIKIGIEYDLKPITGF